MVQLVGVVGNLEIGIMESSLVFLNLLVLPLFILLYKYILLFSGVKLLHVSTMLLYSMIMTFSISSKTNVFGVFYYLYGLLSSINYII